MEDRLLTVKVAYIDRLRRYATGVNN